MQRFQNDTGYTMQEMYALSYNGLGNYYAGLPTRTAPSALDRDYVAQFVRPAPTRWMTVYDGFEGDPFYVGPDTMSPRLRGADNRTFPGAYHNDLRVDPGEVDAYLTFLLRRGQRGIGANPHGAAQATRIQQGQPDGLNGPPLCGVPALTGPLPPAGTQPERSAHGSELPNVGRSPGL